MSDQPEVPEGHRIVTFERLEVILRRSFGPGTYPVPDEIADEVDRRRKRAAGPISNKPAQISVTGNHEDDEKLLAFGVRDVSVLSGLSADEIKARIPELTPVGAARVAERANAGRGSEGQGNEAS